MQRSDPGIDKENRVSHQSLSEAFSQYKRGEMDRRTFAHLAIAAGLSVPVVTMITNQVSAQSSPASTDLTNDDKPHAGTENQERGAGGELKLIQWQAPTQLSPHVSSGVKDYLAALPVVEPLIHYLTDARMVPNLITRVPSVENGLLNEDLTEVTIELLPDLLWSDGEPVTSADVEFTINWVLDKENASSSYSQFETIDHVEIIDDKTIKVVFANPNPFWMNPFAGTSTGYLYPKHILEGGKEAHDAFLSAPIGTGPYKIESFSANDEVRYVINENYREPNKPFFSSIYLKGGGDPAAAARAVIQTGEYDFAWYLQTEISVLTEMESDDSPGRVIPYSAATVERIHFQFADPRTEVNGQPAEMNTPNPRLADKAVREAIGTAINRQLIVDEFYGDDMSVAVNIVQGDPLTYSQNTSYSYDPDKANKILDDAGWVLNDGVREKDGVKLDLTYATETNALSQKTQAVVKANLEEIGIQVQLESIDPGMFYDASAGNTLNLNHFYWDMDMWKSVPPSPRPITFMNNWYSGENLDNISQESNGWSAGNTQRYISEDFDSLYLAALEETDPEALADLFIQMNDHLIENFVIVPLVVVGTPRGMSKRLREENISLAPFSYDYWNIANWNTVE